MSKSGTITLTTVSSNITTLDLYSCTGPTDNTCDGTAFATNIPKANLQSGYDTNDIPDNGFYIKIKPQDGSCVNMSPYIIQLQGAPALSPTPTHTPTQTPTPTPTPPDGFTHLHVKSGSTPTNACTGTTINVKYSGAFAYDTTILRLEDGTPVPDGYYYTVDGIYAGVVWIVDSACMGCTHTAGNIHNFTLCPSPTPIPVELINLYLAATDSDACNNPMFGPITLTGYGGTHINDVQGFTNIPTMYTDPIGATIYIRQSYKNFVGDILHTQVRRFTLSGNDATAADVATDCPAPNATPTPTPTSTPPAMNYTVNVYAHATRPPDQNNYDSYVVYGRASYGNSIATVRGVPKAQTPTPLVFSNDIVAGDTLKLGTWLNYDSTGPYNDYMQVRAYVFVGNTAFNFSRFGMVLDPVDQLATLGSLEYNQGGCSEVISGILNGIEYTVGQSVDIYLVMGSNGCGFTGTVPVTGGESQQFNQ